MNFMKKKMRSKMPAVAVILFGAVCMILLSPNLIASVNAQPGTPHDPLVSRSYVDNRIAALEAQIQQLTALIASLEESSHTVGQAPEAPPIGYPSLASGRELFTIVHARVGTTLIGGASTEIILRAGQATVVAGENGLTNVTAGHDVMSGQTVQPNHLLIVPRDDGRGLHFHTDAYLMIKGDYFILY